jgi:hypothetical protein
MRQLNSISFILVEVEKKELVELERPKRNVKG